MSDQTAKIAAIVTKAIGISSEDAARHLASLRTRKGPKPKRTLTCDCGARLSRTEARTHRCVTCGESSRHDTE